MGWEELVSSLVQSVSWPMAAVVLGVLFRGELKGLLNRLKDLSLPGGTTASFATELDQGEVYVAEVKRDLPQDALQRRYELELAARKDAALDEAESNAASDDNDEPTAQVIVAWAELEAAVLDLRRAQTIVGRPPVDVRVAVRQLVGADVVPQAFAQAMTTLRDLRNKAAHAELMPTKASARTYVQNARELRDTARALTPTQPQH